MKHWSELGVPDARRSRQHDLFSALMSPADPPHPGYRVWQTGPIERVTCSVQLEEIRRASRCLKFRNIPKPHHVDRMITDLQGTALMNGFSQGHEAADPHNTWLLGLTDAAHADDLVTGDKSAGLLSRMRIANVRILTAATFRQDVLREDK